MTELSSSGSIAAAPDITWSQHQKTALLQGEILVQTRSHSAWGGAVTAQMHLPLVLHRGEGKRLYQVARKAFLFFSAQVEVYLNVFEVVQQQIQFQLEQGTFGDFAADLKLQDFSAGTLLTYAVQATPNIPIPTIFIQQAMHFELPENMRKMRQVLCTS